MSESLMICDCFECGKETNNDILYQYTQTETITEDDGREDMWNTTFYTLKCRGCDYVHFMREVYYPDFGGEPVSFKDSFPDSLSDIEYNENHFLSEEEIRKLPPIVRNLYMEVESSFSIETPILSGIGLRTLLESICIHQEITGRNLKDKIDNLHKKGLIAAKDLPVLHNLREIGNITVHQIKKSNQKTLDYSLEILNHTLKSLYVIPSLHTKITKTTLRK